MRKKFLIAGISSPCTPGGTSQLPLAMEGEGRGQRTPRTKDTHQYMKTLAKIISILGGVKNLHASITNEPYMRLVIEDIGQGPRGQAIPPVYQEVFDSGSEDARLKRQLISFAQQWDRNLGEQGFVTAAVTQQAKAQGAKA